MTNAVDAGGSGFEIWNAPSSGDGQTDFDTGYAVARMLLAQDRGEPRPDANNHWRTFNALIRIIETRALAGGDIRPLELGYLWAVSESASAGSVQH